MTVAPRGEVGSVPCGIDHPARGRDEHRHVPTGRFLTQPAQELHAVLAIEQQVEDDQVGNAGEDLLRRDAGIGQHGHPVAVEGKVTPDDVGIHG